MLTHWTMDTPAGPFTAVVTTAGAVRASGFTTDVEELMRLVHPGLVEETRPADDVGPVGAAVRSYLDGDLTAIDDVPVEQRIGGTFITHAWQVMRDIKPGSPLTYTAFAALAGRPAAALQLRQCRAWRPTTAPWTSGSSLPRGSTAARARRA